MIPKTTKLWTRAKQHHGIDCANHSTDVAKQNTDGDVMAITGSTEEKNDMSFVCNDVNTNARQKYGTTPNNDSIPIKHDVDGTAKSEPLINAQHARCNTNQAGQTALKSDKEIDNKDVADFQHSNAIVHSGDDDLSSISLECDN